MKIHLDKSIYGNGKLSPHGIAAYCSIKILLQKEKSSKICVERRTLEYQLTESIENTKRFTGNLNAGVQELISAGYLNLLNKVGLAHVIDCTNLLSSENKKLFTAITLEEVHTIFKIKKSNRFNILSYFINTIDTINNTQIYTNAKTCKKRIIGNMSIDYIANIAGVSPIAAIEYNRLLEEEGLIYISRQGYSYNQKLGSPYRSRNIYGRAEDKEHIEEYARKRKNSKNKLENGEINNIKSN